MKFNPRALPFWEVERGFGPLTKMLMEQEKFRSEKLMPKDGRVKRKYNNAYRETPKERYARENYIDGCSYAHTLSFGGNLGDGNRRIMCS